MAGPERLTPAPPPVGEEPSQQPNATVNVAEIRADEDNSGALQSTDIFLECGAVTLLVNIPVDAHNVTYAFRPRGGELQSGTIHPAPSTSMGEDRLVADFRSDVVNKLFMAQHCACRDRDWTRRQCVDYLVGQFVSALATERQQHAERTRVEVEKACAAERNEIAFDIAENPNSPWTATIRLELDAQHEEIAALAEQIAEKDRDKRLLLSQICGIDHASMAHPCEPPANYNLYECIVYRRGWESVHNSAVAMEITGRLNRTAVKLAAAESREAALRAELVVCTDERDALIADARKFKQEIETLKQEKP